MESKMLTLSKSEFKLAYDCSVKLKYKKQHYPKSTDDDDFMEMLAEGGYMVGALAQLLFPSGVDINTDKTHSTNIYENTAIWMQQENVVLFEAAFKTTDGRNIRVDIIEKLGNQINLLEVKAKSWNSDTYIFDKKPPKSDKENVSKTFEPYLLDVTFQHSVLEELYSDFFITPYLYLPDKSKTTVIEGLNGLFSITKKETTAGGFKNYDVTFNGNSEALLIDDIMTKVEVNDFVQKNKKTVVNKAKEMLSYMNEGFDDKLFFPVLDSKCKNCEYRLKEDNSEKNGYKECWKDLAYHDNHIFGLYQFGNIFKGEEKQRILQDMITQKNVTLIDIPDDLFYKKNSNELNYNGRPFYQRTLKTENIKPELFDEMSVLESPLYFIDFECSRMALPYHKNMRPYEIVAYQWSLHYYNNDGILQHDEWINTTDAFPNFKFAESLFNKTKASKTILIWSHYEKTVLKEILNQHVFYKANKVDGVDLMSDAVVEWLEKWASINDEDTWVTDMEKMCKKYYFHPDAKGRSSIKPILPAVLNETTAKETIALLENFSEGLNLFHKENGKVQDPYHYLPKINLDGIKQDFDELEENGSDYLPGGDSSDYIVKNGGAAMRAYQDMMYGFAKEKPSQKDDIKNLLLQYCKLDTLAMVIIWKYWEEKRG